MHRPLPVYRSPCCGRHPRDRRRRRSDARLVLCVATGLLCAIMTARAALAEGESVSARPQDGADVSEDHGTRAGRPKAPRPRGSAPIRGDSTGTRPAHSDGWWSKTAFIALVGAVGGGIVLAARRLGPCGAAGAVQVVGRVSLSSRHSVYLLQVGRRVLVVGAGPQGPPALLTELDDVIEDSPPLRTEAES